MGAIVAHSLIFSLLLRPAPTKLVKIPLHSAEEAEHEPDTAKDKLLHSLPKLFMFLGWVGIMGGHLFQVSVEFARVREASRLWSVQLKILEVKAHSRLYSFEFTRVWEASQ